MTYIARIDPHQAAQIGPNAVLQLTEALRAAGLQDQAPALFARAGVSRWLTEPPGGMVDQEAAGRLHQVVRTSLPRDRVAAVMEDAGRRTGDYLLAHRIPGPAQQVLRVLPAWLSARLLAAAIAKHAWTFAGSGRFTARSGMPTLFTLVGNPLRGQQEADAPVCAWHAAVFERLFQALVHPRAQAVETACEASGGGCCHFVVGWPR